MLHIIVGIMKILNVGSGPVTNGKLPGLEIVNCDIKDFPDTEKQHMENLTYPDNSFDVVACINALDHTRDARQALDELLRVAQWFVYIKCWLDQKQTGYKHYWDFKEDGSFTNGTETYYLRDFGFKVKYTDFRGERRYNYIEATRCLV